MRKSIIATAIVGLLLGGGAAEARHLIGTRDIKNHAVTWSKLSRQVEGDIGLGEQSVTAKLHLFPNQTSFDVDQNFAARCPSGTTVVGTGFNGGVGQTAFVEKFGNIVGAFFANNTSIDYDVEIQAICGDTAFDVSAAKADEAALHRAEAAAQRAHDLTHN